MDDFAVHAALVEIWSFIGAVNRYIDAAQPWALAKDPAQQPRLAAVLVTLADALRYLGIVLEPFVPDAAARIRVAVGDPRRPLLTNAVVGRGDERGPVERLSGLFPADRHEGPAAAAGAPATRRRARARRGASRSTSSSALDLRVAEIVAAEAVPKSKKLLKLTSSSARSRGRWSPGSPSTTGPTPSSAGRSSWSRTSSRRPSWA